MLFGEGQALEVHVLVARHVAKGAFRRADMTVDPFHDPLQNAHVLTVARPGELAVGILAEPVGAEDHRQLDVRLLAHVDPVSPIRSHVVAAEGQHGEGIAPDAGHADGRRSGFRTHGGRHEHAVVPIVGLIDQREGLGQTAAEDESRNRYARRIFPGGIDGRTLRRGGGEAGVGVRAQPATVRCPVVALPVDAMSRRLHAHAFPPDVAVIGQHDVGKDAVGFDRFHRHRVGIVGSTRGDAEEPRFGVDGAQRAVRRRLDPGDIVADGQRFPVTETLGWYDHRQVGLAAGTGESGRDIGLVALGRFETQDQHVFGQPALVARHHRGDAQRQALLAQQGIAAIAGPIGPNFAGFGIMDNGLAADVRLARPRHVFLPGGQRRADGVYARDEEAVATQRVEHLLTHAGHDPHVGDDVSRVGDLDADLSDRAADRAHAERNDVHGTAAHATLELFLELCAHFGRWRPVVGWAGVFFLFRADEGAVFNARHIGRMGAGEIGIRAFLRIQSGEGTTLHHLFAQPVVFFLRTVAPANAIGLGYGSYFIHPIQQFGVAGPVFTIMSDCHRLNPL